MLIFVCQSNSHKKKMVCLYFCLVFLFKVFLFSLKINPLKSFQNCLLYLLLKSRKAIREQLLAILSVMFLLSVSLLKLC